MDEKVVPESQRVHVSKCTAGVPPARGRLAGREDEGGRDARGTLWATHLLTCTQSQQADAFHLAFAVVHRIDYLMTWNQAHLANPEMLPRLSALCRKRGWRAPLLVTPETIPRASLGQTIRRPDEEDDAT